MTATESPCRACDGVLETILDLGDLRLSTFPTPDVDLRSLPHAPLDLCRCRACGLVQLRHTVSPDAMFRQYWYRSGVNEVMQAELAHVAEQALSRVGPLKQMDVVMDIGANDGTLLRTFDHTAALRVAYEPALNLFPLLRPHCDVLLSDYFPNGLEAHKGLAGRVKILTSIACFYAVQDPHDFITGVSHLLHPDGVWVVQFQDLHQMLQATAFDNICHEHLFYPSLAAIERLVEPHGLRVVDAEVRKINGGSLRLTIQHQEAAASPKNIVSLVEVEKVRQWEAGCEDWQTLERFAWRVGEMKQQILGTLANFEDQGCTIDCYGASTKGNTLLQYCGIDHHLIRQAWERSPEKVGRTTVTGIPIVSEEEGRSLPPSVCLATIWQFREAILRREAAYLDHGGSLLFPLPVCDLVVSQEAL